MVFRYYFNVPKNPGEQFYLFTLLTAWLIQKGGRLFEKPQEYDDPNATISKILDVLRENVGVHILCLKLISLLLRAQRLILLQIN